MSVVQRHACHVGGLHLGEIATLPASRHSVAFGNGQGIPKTSCSSSTSLAPGSDGFLVVQGHSTLGQDDQVAMPGFHLGDAAAARAVMSAGDGGISSS